MAQGTIKSLISDRGFGFILPEQRQADSKDLFFHRSDMQGSSFEALSVGQQIEYDLGRDERKGTPKATNVRLLPQAQSGNLSWIGDRQEIRPLDSIHRSSVAE